MVMITAISDRCGLIVLFLFLSPFCSSILKPYLKRERDIIITHHKEQTIKIKLIMSIFTLSTWISQCTYILHDTHTHQVNFNNLIKQKTTLVVYPQPCKVNRHVVSLWLIISHFMS